MCLGHVPAHIALIIVTPFRRRGARGAATRDRRARTWRSLDLIPAGPPPEFAPHTTPPPFFAPFPASVRWGPCPRFSVAVLSGRFLHPRLRNEQLILGCSSPVTGEDGAGPQGAVWGSSPSVHHSAAPSRSTSTGSFLYLSPSTPASGSSL